MICDATAVSPYRDSQIDFIIQSAACMHLTAHLQCFLACFFPATQRKSKAHRSPAFAAVQTLLCGRAGAPPCAGLPTSWAAQSVQSALLASEASCRLSCPSENFLQISCLIRRRAWACRSAGTTLAAVAGIRLTLATSAMVLMCQGVPLVGSAICVRLFVALIT